MREWYHCGDQLKDKYDFYPDQISLFGGIRVMPIDLSIFFIPSPPDPADRPSPSPERDNLRLSQWHKGLRMSFWETK